VDRRGLLERLDLQDPQGLPDQLAMQVRKVLRERQDCPALLDFLVQQDHQDLLGRQDQ